MLSKLGFVLPRIFKYAVLAITFAILLMFTQSAFAKKEYQISIFLVLAIALIAVTYLSSVSIPLKFFAPGVLFLVAFVVIPIVYTVAMSTFKYQTGNYISKEQAIERIKLLGTAPDANSTTFDVVLGKYNGELAILASDSVNKKYFISTSNNKLEVNPNDLTIDENGIAQSATDFKSLSVGEKTKIDREISVARFKFENEYFIMLEGSGTGSVVRQSFEYDPKKDQFNNLITGDIYQDDGKGNFANTSNPQDILQPGWRAPIWFSHYIDIVKNQQVRGPLFSVFLWTVIFAGLTVLTQFSLGLLVAIAMNKKIRGRRLYRSIFILPYAMPSIMSILIWAGMFNTEFGAINTLLGTDIAWFQNPNFARFAVILVNLWLGFPYFYLINSGAMQAIPSELSEAAAIDGASPRQIFSKITLPLLLKIVSPLLIASFAFNFNNFNLIYLLTGGGPRNELDGEMAGATDILISYTYRIAFGTNVQDLGFASAISVVIFFIVAAISLYGVRKSKVLDTFS